MVETKKETKTLHERLAEIQGQLKCGKDQYNAFAKFKYRSCEDILKAVKPLLNGLVLYLDDELIELAGRVYIKATAKLVSENGDHASISAFAREPDSKTGMDASMVTGCASSYARKYALNGLLLTDDGVDADGLNLEVNGKKAETDAIDKNEGAPELTLIKSVTLKSGKRTDGTAWTRYTVKDANGNSYSTFDKTLAEVARIAKDKKAECLITHKNDGYKTLELIEVQDPNTKPAATEDVPDGEIPF